MPVKIMIRSIITHTPYAEGCALSKGIMNGCTRHQLKVLVLQGFQNSAWHRKCGTENGTDNHSAVMLLWSAALRSGLNTADSMSRNPAKPV